MELKKIEVITTTNVRATMQEMNIGEYFEVSRDQHNTVSNYASNIKMGGEKLFVIKTDGDIVRVTRIENTEVEN